MTRLLDGKFGRHLDDTSLRGEGSLEPVHSGRADGAGRGGTPSGSVSDSGGLASLPQSLQFLAPTTLAGLLVVSFATHFLAESATLAQLAEAADGLLNRLAGTNP
jgi:hypothetical protein